MSQLAPSILDRPALPSRHLLNLALARRRALSLLDSTLGAIKALGLQPPSLEGVLVAYSISNSCVVRKLSGVFEAAGPAASTNRLSVKDSTSPGGTSAIDLSSVHDGADLSNQQWDEVEADFCRRLLSGHEQPVTLREIRAAYCRYLVLSRCRSLLDAAVGRTASTHGSSETVIVVDAALRRQLQDAMQRPEMSDWQWLEWLGRTRPWDEELARVKVAAVAAAAQERQLGQERRRLPQQPREEARAAAAAASLSSEPTAIEGPAPLLELAAAAAAGASSHAAGLLGDGEASPCELQAPQEIQQAGSAAAAVDASACKWARRVHEWLLSQRGSCGYLHELQIHGLAVPNDLLDRYGCRPIDFFRLFPHLWEVGPLSTQGGRLLHALVRQPAPMPAPTLARAAAAAPTAAATATPPPTSHPPLQRVNSQDRGRSEQQDRRQELQQEQEPARGWHGTEDRRSHFTPGLPPRCRATGGSRSHSHSRSPPRLRSRSPSRPRTQSRSRSRSPRRTVPKGLTIGVMPPAMVEDELAWAEHLHRWLEDQPGGRAKTFDIVRFGYGVPAHLLEFTRARPERFWENHPDLWTYYPRGTRTPGFLVVVGNRRDSRGLRK